MKQGKRLTRRQKEYLSENRLNPQNWMLLVESDKVLLVEHKETGTIKKVCKGI